ncbi:MAG: SLBB domain-containing protein [Bacteroidota bacterium]|nr:SLBB domain-containing protein [Bacteroidota bacterium]
MSKTIRILLLLSAGLLFLLPEGPLPAQQLTPQQTTEAKGKLRTMSPEEIDKKIKELGMTREEAEKRAKENGIDLQSFLAGGAGSASSTQTILESGPQGISNIKDQSAAQRTPPSPLKKPIKSDKGLTYFGYEVFSTTPTAFEPSASGPVDPDYIIGPEDVLRVSIWGQVEQQSELTVDKEGRIFLPTAGPVVVSGSTVTDVQKSLVRQLSRSFQGLLSTPPTVWLDVTLARIRPKRIFIMGEVENPGGYTVNSYATIFSSLFAVGGPTVNGSLRDVRLIRGNKVIAKIDLYAYFTGAEKNNDVRVQNNDIIYVPVRKNSLYIKGEIRRRGIYELLPGENLKKLIEFAGGNLPTSYLERVQVERIIPLKERIKNELERRYVDINFREIISKNGDYVLDDGDMITFYSIMDSAKNYVTISGSVYKPGRYQLTPAMKLKDLIQLADSLRPETYFARGELTRLQEDNRTRITIPFDLKALIDGDQTANMALQSKDEVIIHTLDVGRLPEEFVEIFGSVKKPGRYPLTKNMTLVDVLMLAEGYTENASYLQAEVARVGEKKEADTLAFITVSTLPDLEDTVTVNSFAYFEQYRKSDFKLHHRDQIFIRPNPYFHIQQIVTISGEANYPGDYALITHNEYLSELIKRAGGPTTAAYLRGGKLMRQNDRVNVDFQTLVDAPKSSKDVILQAGDSVYIPKKPNAVKIAGEINNPGLLGFVEGNKLWDYIDRAGGLADSADFIILFHPNGNAEKFRTGWFGGNSEVKDGSTIVVTKVPVPPPQKEGESLGQTIKDVFAITVSAVTVIVLAKKL